ncbi:hypothetical protein HZS61_002317 [Fusarium oxysporum f. sp. conglutinans]|uniref:Uncharacterized protein n=1 Tax=Fusarium oxysporum f. sp. conglutinans TaxID=100902 RepID=A0A8H6LFH6_FUSOX|nr:hypothetical protein HZS61_002317 [Fusarium oxysporum f. sp. conglutinans]
MPNGDWHAQQVGAMEASALQREALSLLNILSRTTSKCDRLVPPHERPSRHNKSPIASSTWTTTGREGADAPYGIRCPDQAQGFSRSRLRLICLSITSVSERCAAAAKTLLYD